MGKNVGIFGVDMCSPVHISNKNKDILIIGQGTAQELGNTTLTVETKYLLVLYDQEKDFYSVYIIMKATVSYLLMLHKYINSKQNALKWKTLHFSR